MKKRLIAIAATALLILAACAREEPESVEERADNLAAQIENRADQLTAEAENGVAQAEAELEAEFADFGNAANGDGSDNAAKGD